MAERRQKSEQEINDEAEFYTRLLGVTDKQTAVLQKLEDGLRARPTKTQGLLWILAGLFAVLVVVVILFNVVLGVSKTNQKNGQIIKAATGCADTNTVRDCETAIALRSKTQIAPYLQAQDCLTRRALAGKPPPERYDVPCQLP